MSSVTGWLDFPNGEQVGACVEIEDNYPQALNEAVAACVDTLLRAMQARRSMVEDD